MSKERQGKVNTIISEIEGFMLEFPSHDQRMVGIFLSY